MLTDSKKNRRSVRFELDEDRDSGKYGYKEDRDLFKVARRVAKGGKKAKKGFYVVELGDDEVDQVSSFEDHSDQHGDYWDDTEPEDDEMKELYPIDETNETETTQKTQKKCKGKKVTPKQFNDSTYKRLMIHEELRKSKIRNKLIQKIQQEDKELQQDLNQNPSTRLHNPKKHIRESDKANIVNRVSCIIKQKEQWLKTQQRLKKEEKSKNEMDGCTFKPKINKISKTKKRTTQDLFKWKEEVVKKTAERGMERSRAESCRKLHKKVKRVDIGTPVEERLLNKGRQTERKLERMRSERSVLVGVGSSSGRKMGNLGDLTKVGKEVKISEFEAVGRVDGAFKQKRDQVILGQLEELTKCLKKLDFGGEQVPLKKRGSRTGLMGSKARMSHRASSRGPRRCSMQRKSLQGRDTMKKSKNQKTEKSCLKKKKRAQKSPVNTLSEAFEARDRSRSPFMSTKHKKKSKPKKSKNSKKSTKEASNELKRVSQHRKDPSEQTETTEKSKSWNHQISSGEGSGSQELAIEVASGSSGREEGHQFMPIKQHKLKAMRENQEKIAHILKDLQDQEGSGVYGDGSNVSKSPKNCQKSGEKRVSHNRQKTPKSARKGKRRSSKGYDSSPNRSSNSKTPKNVKKVRKSKNLKKSQNGNSQSESSSENEEITYDINVTNLDELELSKPLIRVLDGNLISRIDFVDSKTFGDSLCPQRCFGETGNYLETAGSDVVVPRESRDLLDYFDKIEKNFLKGDTVRGKKISKGVKKKGRSQRKRDKCAKNARKSKNSRFEESPQKVILRAKYHQESRGEGSDESQQGQSAAQAVQKPQKRRNRRQRQVQKNQPKGQKKASKSPRRASSRSGSSGESGMGTKKEQELKEMYQRKLRRETRFAKDLCKSYRLRGHSNSRSPVRRSKIGC